MKFESFGEQIRNQGTSPAPETVGNAIKNEQEKKLYKTLQEIAKPGHQYRAIGIEGFRDIQETGIIRANQDPQPKISDGDIALKAKHMPAPFFVGSEYIETLAKYNPDYLIEYPKTPEISFARPSAGGHFGNTPWSDPNTMIRELPAKNATIYKNTPEGYEKIEI